jgi:hypothetical protein
VNDTSPISAELATRVPEIAQVCRDFEVRRLLVFGSAMTPEFDPSRSDVDLLVEFEPDVDLGPWLSRLTRLKAALETVLHRQVDVVMPAALRNPRFRDEAAKTLTPLYDARQVASIAG